MEEEIIELENEFYSNVFKLVDNVYNPKTDKFRRKIYITKKYSTFWENKLDD